MILITFYTQKRPGNLNPRDNHEDQVLVKSWKDAFLLLADWNDPSESWDSIPISAKEVDVVRNEDGTACSSFSNIKWWSWKDRRSGKDRRKESR